MNIKNFVSSYLFMLAIFGMTTLINGESLFSRNNLLVLLLLTLFSIFVSLPPVDKRVRKIFAKKEYK